MNEESYVNEIKRIIDLNEPLDLRFSAIKTVMADYSYLKDKEADKLIDPNCLLMRLK